ncbi:MAG: bifunctional transaldolase/phosoglucose isomerase [Desulfomonile sp.]|nr:bifunctional transaldolase/phosoglucose isomerase [Desulfomonile sp.]
MTNPLRSITELGQSIWCDDLGRELLRSGELKRMIDEDGITGVTSNPTIFEKAIGGSKTYDADIHELVDQGLDIQGIYQGLVVPDIREAADLLRPVYERSGGVDGYVSLEVPPDLAYSAPKTVAEARRLFTLVDRPNLMIKVPATRQGFRAVKELISSGINVNVTLIFSLEQYRSAAQAYLDGIAQWISEGGDPAKVASVASFFVSRVDTVVDERLQDLVDPAAAASLKNIVGKTAIANAKAAYGLYREMFHGGTFARLRTKGARPQRIVWASTSTKNPEYPDTYYVDALIGPETVNTMPRTTLEAYRHRGRPQATLADGLEEAQAILARLEQEQEVNLPEVMSLLLDNGVKAFAESFDQLLDGIAQKRIRLMRGWGHRSASLGHLQQRVDDTLSQWDKNRLVERIWNCDTSLWKDDPQHGAEISRRLGWLTVVDTMRRETQRLREFADEIRSQGFSVAVLLGMGGSSLAAEVFASCIGVAEGFLNLKVLDTTIPRSILEVERTLDPRHTLFIVSSKSGGTIEVMSLYKRFRCIMDKAVGADAGAHFIAITDPGTSLGKLAAEDKFRKVFLNPPDIGGRFSALSYFGLVPAALIGADLDRLLMRAGQSAESAATVAPSLENPGVWLGAIMAEAARAGRDKLTLVISPPLRSFGCWLEQLLAESTGKEGTGIIPIEGETPGDPDEYGTDRIFIYLRLDGDDTYDSFITSMEKIGRPVVTLRLHGAYDIGREMFRWEFATAVAGAILGVNPFDQPNVQEAKTLTNKLLHHYRDEGSIPGGRFIRLDEADAKNKLAELLEKVKPGDYVAFNAFIHPSQRALELLQTARTAVRRRRKVATTLGFGPRFLHSTGQIHKGGPNTGVFIEITMSCAEDADIPGEPYSFAVLKDCQGLGDFEALEKRGRRIVRIHLSSETDLTAMAELLQTL